MRTYSLSTLFLVLCSLALFVPAQAHASGFSLPEQGAAAMGMANAFVGQADDITAVWHNPAGITRLEGTQMGIGTTLIYPSFKHQTFIGMDEAPEHKLFHTVNLYGTQKVSDRLSLGIGINNPFGLSTTWSPGSTTSGVATLSGVATINTNVNAAYKISDALALAAGINYMYLDATLDSRALLLNGDGTGWGANAAVLYSASDRISIGLGYRRKIKVQIDGKINDLLPAKADIILPDELKMGLAIKASDTVTVNIEADLTNWSTNNQIVLPAVGVIDPNEWMDTWCYRVGGQYKLSAASKLRFGVFYDTNPVRSEYFETRTPVADRYGFTLGAGRSLERMTIDVAYLYLKSKARTINYSIEDDILPAPYNSSLNGTYTSTAHLAGVSIGYKF